MVDVPSRQSGVDGDVEGGEGVVGFGVEIGAFGWLADSCVNC